MLALIVGSRIQERNKKIQMSRIWPFHIIKYQLDMNMLDSSFVVRKYLKSAFISMGVKYLKSFDYISMLEKVLSHVKVIKVFSSLFVNSKQLPNWLWQGYQLNVSWLLVIPYKMSVLFFKLHKQGINTTL